MHQTIHFDSNGLRLSGNLFYPKAFVPDQKYPAIVVGGSWTTVKEQMSGLYSAHLSQHGFITLAFDPSYFGESEGEPRYWEDPATKIADYKNAISFLQTLPEVDTERIYLVAVCASAGYMAAVAAVDDRVKGLATVAAWLHDAAAVQQIYGGEEGVREKIQQSQIAQKRFAEKGEVVYIPAISTSDPNAAMFGPYDYYLNSKRGGLPQWRADKFAVMSWEGWLSFDPLPLASAIRQPVIMIHADDAVLAVNARRFFKDIAHTHKTMYWTTGTQFDFYDNPVNVSEAVAAISVFFDL